MSCCNARLERLQGRNIDWDACRPGHENAQPDAPSLATSQRHTDTCAHLSLCKELSYKSAFECQCAVAGDLRPTWTLPPTKFTRRTLKPFAWFGSGFCSLVLGVRLRMFEGGLSFARSSMLGVPLRRFEGGISRVCSLGMFCLFAWASRAMRGAMSRM